MCYMSVNLLFLLIAYILYMITRNVNMSNAFAYYKKAFCLFATLFANYYIDATVFSSYSCCKYFFLVKKSKM
jgi:hypothetical protein